ncbi:LLM class flavin-dependent oxidoreductase [Streptomyces sp. NPDC012466]|jgi:alkanesulfonate monooxygenase SsuD/methylene tetrahydromethanopterin reductase-like flavin-dependent oxidoreductase (luciferase family)|uniref:LLM class flavin-dependent oxidoreductase n=1 Tax=Streptomyces sp. NPDC012466 TaxID=3364835 RepID=UPI0036EBC7D4
MTAPLLVGRIDTHADDATLDSLTALARAAEHAGFDALILDDSSRPPGGQGRFETTTLAAALAARTDHIGLIVSPLPADQAPYHVARIVASLDHLGRGRTGWLAGAGDPEGRTAELIEVARGLWDSFDDDAYVHDRADGLYWRLDAIHRLDHRGRHFDVAGPLNVARPPQGHPVVAVSGPALAAQADLVLLDDPADLPGVRAEAPGAKVLVPLLDHADAERLLAASGADGLVVPLRDARDPFLTTTPSAAHRAGTTPASLRARLGLRRPAGRYATGTV